MALLVVATATGLGACAYNYAGQPGKSDPEEEGSSDPTVVDFESESESDSDSSDNSASDGQGGDADSGPAESDSPCGVETFKIHYYDASTRATKTIDCSKRKVVSVNRSPISQSELREAQKTGLPENTWYLLVDPEGLRASFLSNDQLVGVSEEFDLQFLGRDDERDLLIYEYQDDL